MRKKINLLIIISVLGLIALSVIQGYLINNTYTLKKEAFIDNTRKSISRLDDFSPELDSLAQIWQESFLNKSADYLLKQATKEDVLNTLQQTIDSINTPFVEQYQKELARKNIPYGIKFQRNMSLLILQDSIKKDTIFDKSKAKRRIILGDNINSNRKISVSNTLWETDYSNIRLINGKQHNVKFDIIFFIQDNMDIEGWETEVFKQMQTLLLLSVLIFIIVIGLLYYAIRSIITQKKIADIKTDFVNNITHELKTPLATLTLATKMLKNNELKQQPKFIDNTVNTIERQNKRLQKLIDQVLNNSLGYAEIKLQKETVNIKNYIITVLDDFKLSVTDKNVIINHSFKIEKQDISIDKFYITTAILNILENAVKYNGDDVEISCTVESNAQLRISISDNGSGISDKEKKQVFEKFYRAGNKEIHNVKGLGLGLYYTNQIIKAHNGYIKLNSKKNIGSTFTMVLPLD